jgi:hypothetical protein
MSVIAWSAEELGTICKVLTYHHLGNRDEARAMWSRLLATISGCNAQAYRETYGDEMVPVSADDIYAASARGAWDHDKALAQAVSTTRLLAYNCMANNGRDYTPSNDALITVVGAMFRILADRLEEVS